MAKVIIFGIQDNAELALYYLNNDSDHQVVAFCVNSEFMPKDNLYLNYPVVPLEKIEYYYPKENFKFFAPMSPKNMNQDRQKIFNYLKNKGYKFISYISSKATIFNNKIGENCFVLENNTIQPFVTIGNNIVLWSGNHIGHHGKISDHTTITSHVVVSGNCTVGQNCFIGVNASIKNHLSIGEGTFIAMAATLNVDTSPWSVYKGSPAVKLSLSSKSIKF